MATAVTVRWDRVEPCGEGGCFGAQIVRARWYPYYDAPGATMVVHRQLARLFRHVWPRVVAFHDAPMPMVLSTIGGVKKIVDPAAEARCLRGLQTVRDGWRRMHNGDDPPPPLPAFWADEELRLPPRTTTLRAGLCWHGRGNNGPCNDPRSLPPDPLPVLRPLLTLDGVEWIALQLADHAAEVPGVLPLADLRVRDFADTAAVIKQLDLVVTVDTSVSHLAASLGAPTWVLVNRESTGWAGMLGSSPPWYSTARVFKQTVQGEWGPVIEAVRAELETLTS